jgi:hypothetical protein
MTAGGLFYILPASGTEGKELLSFDSQIKTLARLRPHTRHCSDRYSQGMAYWFREPL